MDFLDRCAESARMRLDDPDIEVDERGLQHLVLIDHRRGVVARFPRSEAGCLQVEDAADKMSLLQRHGIAVPRVLGLHASGGPGRAHLLLSFVPGCALDTVRTDDLSSTAQDRLIADLQDTTAAIHAVPARLWPSQGPTWVGLWSDLLRRVQDCDALPQQVQQQQVDLARAALAVARRARIGVFHGDLGGVNCRIDAATGAVTGVIDWDSAAVGDVATDLVAILHGVGPATARRLRSFAPQWESAWIDYQAYVRTWPVQSYLWSLEQGDAEQRRASRNLLLRSRAAGTPR